MLVFNVGLEATWLMGTTGNGLQLGTQARLARCWTGLCFVMEQKLWAVVLILALLKTKMGLFPW